jgi:hypothetical protein
MNKTAKVISIAEPVTKHRAQGGGQPKLGDIVELSSWHGDQGVWWCRAIELNEYGDRLYGANFLPEQLEILSTDEGSKHQIVCVPYDESKCDRSGCGLSATEYVLLPGGAVHLCASHANEAKEYGCGCLNCSARNEQPRQLSFISK